MRNPQQIGVELCEAWGLDPGKVRAITINVRVGEITTADVELIDDTFVAVVKRYELHEPTVIESVA